MRQARLTSKQWTPLDDERLRSLAISGIGASEIATELERTVSAVRSRAERKLGVSLIIEGRRAGDLIGHRHSGVGHFRGFMFFIAQFALGCSKRN
jgi:hypothetical protein